MAAQDTLDRAFQVSPQDRATLRSGRIPESVHRRLRTAARSSFSGGVALSIVLVMLAGMVLGWLVSPRRDDRALAFLLLLALPATLMLWVRLREWRHERKVLATRPPLRVLEGPVETIRTWEYGYGDCYHLWTALKFVGQPEEPVNLFEKVGTHIISGWARVFLATVSSRKGSLAPYYETPVALEVADDTHFVEREPGKPPPGEPLRANVPAD